MSRISASAILLIASALPMLGSDVTSSATTGISKVRIVRLSEMKGEVRVDLNNGHGFEAAMPNLPIVEQMRLATGTGVAEVEFEDNSTLRLAPDSLVEFPRLELLPTGAKASIVHVLKGMVYVSLVETKGNDFSLLFGQRKLQLPPSSHVRLELTPAEAKLAVLDGTVSIDGPAGPEDVQKKKTVTFAITGQDASAPMVAKRMSATDYDAWDHESADYHKRFAAYSALGNSANSYGAGDMNYYGSFSDAGGCGSMWHPYFASASWEPYSNGAWAYYQNAGYSWVSPYPWAWTPYHSGSWSYCPGAGWGWLPGSNWNGLNNSPISGALLTHRPNLPTQKPKSGEPSLRLVNTRPLTASTLTSEESFMFRKDSAGLGVPRGTLGNLSGLSRESARRGSATTPVYSTAPVWSPAGGQTMRAGELMAGSVHRGYAVSPSFSSAASSGSRSLSGFPAAGSGVSASGMSSAGSSGHAESGSSHPK